MLEGKFLSYYKNVNACIKQFLMINTNTDNFLIYKGFDCSIIMIQYKHHSTIIKIIGCNGKHFL